MEERNEPDYIMIESHPDGFKRLDKKALKSWKTARLIGLLVVAVIFIGVRILIRNWDDGLVLGASITLGAILVLMLLNAFIYPKIEYRQWIYKITEDKIEFFHGIFFIKHTIIPMLRVQHITVNQGPINKRYYIATINISTAGGIFNLVGLPKEEADEICRYINDNVIRKLKDKLHEKEELEETEKEIIIVEEEESEANNNG